MRNLFLLLKIRLDEIFELSSTKAEKSPVKKLGAYVHKLIMLAIYVICFGVIYNIADFMGKIGLVSVLPIIGYIFALIVTFLVVVLMMNDIFSGNEDSEFLLSTPIGTFTQVISTFIIIYGRNLFYSFIIEFPFYLGYMKYSDVKLGVARWILGLLFTSLPICGIATLIGMVLILSLVHSPKKNQIMSIISLSFMAIAIVIMIAVLDRVYLIASGNVVIDSESVSVAIIKELSRNLKFARFYQNGIVKGDVGYTMLFIFMSVIWYAVLLFMHTMAYQSAITALRSPVTYGEKTADEILNAMVPSSEKAAMLKKEIAQFVGSKSYMLHAMPGMLLGIILPINFLIVGAGDFKSYSSIIPWLICVLVGFSNITYCSMSMEGRRFWILETSPSEGAALKWAKTVVNLIFVMPMAILSGILFSVAFEASIVEILLNVFVPIIYSIITAFYGITVDYKFANYSSESESIVLGRGTTFLLGYLPMIVLPMIVGLLLY